MARRPASRPAAPRAPSAPSAPAAAPRTPMTGWGGRVLQGPNAGAKVNTQAGNPRAGQPYHVQKAPGGVFHVYPNGRRVFVRAAPASPSAASAESSAAAALPDATPEAAAAEETFTPDAAYLAELARQAAERTQRLGQLAEEDTSDQTNYAEALRRFREQLPKQRRAALEQANAAGLAQSTVHSENVGDLETTAARQETDMSGAYEGRRRAREEARRALLSGATVEEAAARAEAIDRQYERIAERAAEGSYAANQRDYVSPEAKATVEAATKTKPKPKAKAKPAFKTRVVRGKVFRYYPNRKPVYVRKATVAAKRNVNRRKRR